VGGVEPGRDGGEAPIQVQGPGAVPGPDEENQTAVTVSFLAGDPGHLVHSGTLTMTESEWEEFVSEVQRALGDDLEIEDQSQTMEGASTAEAAKRAWT
jgi:hypothetical protein